jgi:hypothetical protein
MKCSTKDIDEDKIDLEYIKVMVDSELDFNRAKEISQSIAKSKNMELLISWYDPIKDFHFPNVDCCGEDVPAWYIYGKNRGGKILIDVNGFKFVYG